MREIKQTKMLGNVIKHVNMNGSARKYQFKLRSQTHNKYSEDNLTGSVCMTGYIVQSMGFAQCTCPLADAARH